MGNCINQNHENYVEFHKNRLIKSGCKIGINEYITTFYYTNGIPKYTISYSNDINTGKYKIYYVDGTLKECGNKVKNKPDGIFRCFYPNSNLEITGTFKNGIKDGTFKEYYQNGNLKCLSSYINGILHGEYREYDERQILNAYIVYNQNKIVKSWFLDRSLDVDELERKFHDNVARLNHIEIIPEEKKDNAIYTVLEIPE